MRRISWARVGCLLLLTAGAVTLVGCGSKTQHARVKGRVKFLDKHLTAGTVAFTSKDGKHVGSAAIDIEGNYDVSDAPVGETVITVKVPVIPKGGMFKDKAKPPPGVPEMKPPGGGGGEDTAYIPPSVDPTKFVQIPGKYASVESSGLTFTVSPGENTKDIVLSP